MFVFLSGDYLRDKYDGATEVKVNKRGKLQIKDPRFSLPSANDLIYVEESPSYCVPNTTVGSLGNDINLCVFSLQHLIKQMINVKINVFFIIIQIIWLFDLN